MRVARLMPAGKLEGIGLLDRLPEVQRQARVSRQRSDVASKAGVEASSRRMISWDGLYKPIERFKRLLI